MATYMQLVKQKKALVKYVDELEGLLLDKDALIVELEEDMLDAYREGLEDGQTNMC